MSELSTTEAETLARIEAAPAAEESLRERVAVAIWDEARATMYMSVGFEGEQRDRIRQERYRRLADVAIATVRGES